MPKIARGWVAPATQQNPQKQASETAPPGMRVLHLPAPTFTTLSEVYRRDRERMEAAPVQTKPPEPKMITIQAQVGITSMSPREYLELINKGRKF